MMLSKVPGALGAWLASHPRKLSLGVGADNGRLRDKAQNLAGTLGLPFDENRACDYVLRLTDEGLTLADTRDARLLPLWVDYTTLDLRPYGPDLNRRQPLARVFGKKVRSVVDATAGLAQDALRLSLMGFRVTAVERHGAVAALAQDALDRFSKTRAVNLEQKLTLKVGDARQLLLTLPAPDAVYLDPMFPPKRKKSAAVRKELKMLRDLVGEDLDAAELLAVARRVAQDRVVVKRPDDAGPLAELPNFSFAGKLVRYDVYLSKKS
jgi:16S rRNA (guanine1516-N2)-methyltransferase